MASDILYKSNQAVKIRSDGADEDAVREWKIQHLKTEYNQTLKRLRNERNGKGSTGELTVLQHRLSDLAKEVIACREADDFSEFFEIDSSSSDAGDGGDDDDDDEDEEDLNSDNGEDDATEDS
jgi:hypothetical protein